jgi:hypothetical protein
MVPGGSSGFPVVLPLQASRQLQASANIGVIASLSWGQQVPCVLRLVLRQWRAAETNCDGRCDDRGRNPIAEQMQASVFPQLSKLRAGGVVHAGDQIRPLHICEAGHLLLLTSGPERPVAPPQRKPDHVFAPQEASCCGQCNALRPRPTTGALPFPATTERRRRMPTRQALPYRCIASLTGRYACAVLHPPLLGAAFGRASRRGTTGGRNCRPDDCGAAGVASCVIMQGAGERLL